MRGAEQGAPDDREQKGTVRYSACGARRRTTRTEDGGAGTD